MNQTPIEECINCSRCKIIPEEYLQMDCHHHICLDCAREELEIAKILIKKESATDSNISNDIFLHCDTCNSTTKLHGKTVEYIENYMPKNMGTDPITEVDINQENTDNEKTEIIEKAIETSDISPNIRESIDIKVDDPIMIMNDSSLVQKKKLVLSKQDPTKDTKTLNKNTTKSSKEDSNQNLENSKSSFLAKSQPIDEQKNSKSNFLTKSQPMDEYNDTRRNTYRDTDKNQSKVTKKTKTALLSSVMKMADKKPAQKSTLNYFKSPPTKSRKISERESQKAGSKEGGDKAASKSLKSDNSGYPRNSGGKLSSTKALATKGSKANTYKMTKNSKTHKESPTQKTGPTLEMLGRKISKNSGEGEDAKSTQSGMLKKSKVFETQKSLVRESSKSIGNSKSPKRSNLNNKQQMILDAIKMNNDIGFDLAPVRKSSPPRPAAPKKVVVEEPLTFEQFQKKIDGLLEKCYKFSSQKPLIENKLQQNYWSVFNAVKEAYKNFARYIRFKENETLQSLESSYYQSLKDYQNEDISCNLLGEKFKLIADGMREIQRCNTFPEKQWFEETNIPKQDEEFVLECKDRPNMELITIIQSKFFEANNKTINKLSDIDKQIKTCLGLPENISDLKSNMTVNSFVFDSNTKDKSIPFGDKDKSMIKDLENNRAIKDLQKNNEILQRDNNGFENLRKVTSSHNLEKMLLERSPFTHDTKSRQKLKNSESRDYFVDYNAYNFKLNEGRRTIFGIGATSPRDNIVSKDQSFNYDSMYTSQIREKRDLDVFNYRTPEKHYELMKSNTYKGKSSQNLQKPNNKISRLLEIQGMNFQSKSSIFNGSRVNNY